MKRIFILNGHPAERSLSRTLVEAYADAARERLFAETQGAGLTGQRDWDIAVQDGSRFVLTPTEAGVSIEAILHFAGKLPILGVCLGHQSIGQYFGGKVVRGGLMHGKVSPVSHDGTGLFQGLPSPFIATRYHSLEVVDVPPELIANAHAETPGADHLSVMGFRHESLPIHSVQFHPESIATEHGHEMLANFLRMAGIEPKVLA